MRSVDDSIIDRLKGHNFEDCKNCLKCHYLLVLSRYTAHHLFKLYNEDSYSQVKQRFIYEFVYRYFSGCSSTDHKSSQRTMICPSFRCAQLYVFSSRRIEDCIPRSYGCFKVLYTLLCFQILHPLRRSHMTRYYLA